MNARGEVVAQHVVLPLHIGAFPACTTAIIDAFGDSIAPGDAFIINHPYQGGSPHAPDVAVITPAFIGDELFGFCGSIAHKSDIGGPVPGSCSGQAREIFNEACTFRPSLPKRPIGPSATSSGSSAPTAARPNSCSATSAGSLAPTGWARSASTNWSENSAGKRPSRASAASWRCRKQSSRRQLRMGDGRFEAERFVDDDGVELEQPVRIHVVVDKQADRLHFDFSGSADQTKGPANIRPPLVQAACAYALISLIDPNMYVSSGLLRGFAMTARDGSVLNPRFPRRSTPTTRPSMRWSTPSSTP
jgi:N-methylhydantoinase B